MANFSATISSSCAGGKARHTVRLTSDSWEAWAMARSQGELLALTGASDVRVDYFAGSHWVAWSRAHRSIDAIEECDQPFVVLPHA